MVILEVYKGDETPYYYSGYGVLEAYVRIGNESVKATATELKCLVLRGKNTSYDSQNSTYKAEDYAFSKLKERYKKWTGNSFDDKDLISFGLVNEQGNLTNAGVLLADESPIRCSRLFCTRWNGLNKSGGAVDALDDAEYSGSVISLIENGEAFITGELSIHELTDGYDAETYLQINTKLILQRKYGSKGEPIFVEEILAEIKKAYPHKREEADRIQRLLQTDEQLRFVCIRKYIENFEKVLLEITKCLKECGVDVEETQIERASIISFGNKKDSQNVIKSPFWSNIYVHDATDEELKQMYSQLESEDNEILLRCNIFLEELKKDVVSVNILDKLIFPPTKNDWKDYSEARKFFLGIKNPGISSKVRYNEQHTMAYVRIHPNVEDVFIINSSHVIKDIYEI